MLRWDEILSLPVQSPPTPEFSASDIVWTKVVGWRDKIDRVARIPFPRVGDFVRGESSNKECPTRFHVEARRRRPPEMHCKQKVDGILEYILYWCSFGPDDHRKGGIVRPSRNTYVPKKKSAGRPNTKRGCVCHFIVKRLIADPSIALIIYNQDKHVDKNDQPCHGPQDKKAVGTRAMFAPYISDDLRLRVLSLLHVGVSVETIMQRHNESVHKQGGPSNRDDLLTHRYVRRLERSIRRSNYELDEDDMVSIGMWVESHQSHVFCYEDFTDSEPFILGIQTEWQLQQMIRFGNCSLVVSDSRFGTNKLKYPVHSLLVFDSDNKLIPVAWIITSRFASDIAHRWIRALYNRVHSKDPTWRLGGFVVDDPSADVLTIREVFHCSVLICFWRVRHAWHKNLVKKCSETEMRFEMFRRLGQAVYSICKGNGDLNLFEDFMEDFVDCSDFLDYFKAIWFPRIGMWITALKTLPLASQETAAALECYHHQLKLRLMNEKNQIVYQRTDWLVDKLGTKVHSYFWLDEYSGKEDFVRYRKDEWMSGLTSWRRALEIPDSDVVFEGRCAKVISQRIQEKAHFVWNPGCEFAVCDCNWSQMGNLCKHVIKVSKICRSKGSAVSSISLFKYNQTLINMLHCPPHDSLIRDHALSLAVYVQMQLNALIGLESSRSAINSVEKQSTGRDSANSARGVANERQSSSENILSSTGTNSGVGDEAQGNVAGNCTGEKAIDQGAGGNGVCGEVAGEVISSSGMNVDPFPSRTSPVSIGSSRDRGVVNEKTQPPSENIACSVETISGVGEAQVNFAGSCTGYKVDDQVSSGNGACGGIANEVFSCTQMDVDVSPTSTSPLELAPPGQVPSTDSNLEIEDMNVLKEDPGNRGGLSFDKNAYRSRKRVRDSRSAKDCLVKKIREASHGDVSERSMMDVEPQVIQTQTSSSTLVGVKESEMAGENCLCSNPSETTAVGNTSLNPQPVQTSPSGSVPIEPREAAHEDVSERSTMDVDPQVIQTQTSSSTLVVVEKSEMAGENCLCSNLSETTAVGNTSLNPQPVQTSPSGSVPIEPREAAHEDVSERSTMDVDPQVIQTRTSSSTLVVVEKSEMAGENCLCSNLSETTAVGNTSLNPQLVQTSPSGSVPIEPRAGNEIGSTNKLDSGERDLQNRSQAATIICNSVNASNLNSEGSSETSASILNSAGLKPLIEVVATENGDQIDSPKDKSPVRLDVTLESIQILSSRSGFEQQTVSGVVYTNDAVTNGETNFTNESDRMIKTSSSTTNSFHIVKSGVQDGSVDENLPADNQMARENGVHDI